MRAAYPVNVQHIAGTLLRIIFFSGGPETVAAETEPKADIQSQLTST